MILHRSHIERQFNDFMFEVIWIERKAFENNTRFVEFSNGRDAAKACQLRQIFLGDAYLRLYRVESGLSLQKYIPSTGCFRPI